MEDTATLASAITGAGLPPGTMLYSKTRHCPPAYSVRDVIGIIPEFLDVEDERPAAEQIDEATGWNPLPGFTFDRFTGELRFPGDPVMYPWVATSLRDELILVYAYGITLIGQPDGSFAVARLD